MRKKRILLTNEDSRLATGYSVHGYELLKRWHEAGYEVAELATYAPGPPKYGWKWYDNNAQNNQEKEVFNSMLPLSEFGYWKFEEVCLDWQPDITVNIRDFWMAAEHDSPYAHIYHYISQLCNDSAPMNPDWVAQLEKSNTIFTFSSFAEKLVKQQLRGRDDKMGPIAPICADENVFKPMNKAAIRASLALPEDIVVIGTVMRNQKRKLYPDLFEAFNQLVQYCRSSGRNDLANKLYLHVHAFYPDLGWDFPRKLCEWGGNRILFTYYCEDCKRMEAKHFAGTEDWCGHCAAEGKGSKSHLPGVGCGVTREDLARVYNNFDLYVQYANAEATGVPILEAAACGIRVMATNYSAMKSFVENTESIPLDVLDYQPEAESGVYRAIPSKQIFVEKAFAFLSQPENMRAYQGMRSRQKYLQYYNWDKTAALWMEAFDKAPEADWKKPPIFFGKIPPNIPPQVFNGAGQIELIPFVDYIIKFYPHTEYERLTLIKNLMNGHIMMGHGYQVCEDSLNMSRAPRQPFGPQEAINYINNRIDRWNYWEQRRKEKFGL